MLIESRSSKWQSNARHFYSLSTSIGIDSIKVSSTDAYSFGISVIVLLFNIMCTHFNFIWFRTLLLSVKILHLIRLFGLDFSWNMKILLGRWHLLCDNIWRLLLRAEFHCWSKSWVLSNLARYLHLSLPCLFDHVFGDFSHEATCLVHGLRVMRSLPLVN